MQPIYQYEERSRSWLAAIAALVGAFLAAAGVYGNAPWYFFAPVLFALLASLWLLIVNRLSGITIAPDQITVFSGAKRDVFARGDLVGYRTSSWSEGPDTVHLLLASGREHTIATYCAGPIEKLRAALEKIGLHRV
jgi:hypothetical protein